MSAFAELIESKNPRASNPAAYDAARKSRRRAEWESRAAAHDVDGPPVRDVLIERNRDAMRFKESSCVDPRVLLVGTSPLAMQRPEAGLHAAAYYAEKYRRTGSLGENESLNPYLDRFRKGDAR